MTDGKSIVQRGLWFEEFEIGTTYLHRPGRTVTEADNVLFTTLTMNTQSLHLDAAWAAEQPGFRGERLVNSMFTLSTLVGLSVAQLTLGTIVANLGFSEVAFPKPVFHGDTLYAETVCTGKRESKSRPGEGIVTLEHTGRNQHGDVVARAVRTTLVQKRPRNRTRRGSMNLRAAGPGWLFCPADRPERFAKAAAAADVVILDLEDGVAESDKPAARKALQDTALDPERTVVRINRGRHRRAGPRPGCPGRYRLHDGDAGEDRIGRAGDRAGAARCDRVGGDPARRGVRRRDRRSRRAPSG